MIPVTSHEDIAAAFKAIDSQLRQCARTYCRSVSRQCGVGRKANELHWRADLGMWLVSGTAADGYWFAFGADAPETFTTPYPTLQVSFLLQGTNRRLCGVVADDADGKAYLLQNGKVSGKRTGVAKSEFARYASDFETADVFWPNGQVTASFVLGRVGDSELPAGIARYMRAVLAFKLSVSVNGKARQIPG